MTLLPQTKESHSDEGSLIFCTLFLRHRIVPAGVPWVTAGDTTRREPSTAKDSEPVDRLIGVLRTGRMESARSARDDFAQNSVIERERLLVKADEQ